MGKRRDERRLGHSHLERLVHYYHFLGEHMQPSARTVSSKRLADLLNMDDTQVRKDLAAIGVRGCPRVGYRSADVMSAIRDVLGFDRTYRAVLIGAGRLGGALAAYRGFVKYGLYIVALFDREPVKAGTTVGGHFVYSTDDLESVIRRNGARLAILTVPGDAAQELADRVVKAGVRAIWNFAPTTLVVPPGVVVRHEHIVVGLAELASHLQQVEDDEARGA